MKIFERTQKKRSEEYAAELLEGQTVEAVRKDGLDFVLTLETGEEVRLSGHYSGKAEIVGPNLHKD